MKKIKVSWINKILIFPSGLWITAFFLMPFFVVFIYTFFSRGIYGNIEYNININNYYRAFEFVYATSFFRSLIYAILTSLITLLIGYPVAYCIVKISNLKVKRLLLFLIILPFWSNYIARIYAWAMLLSDKGIVYQLLFELNLIEENLSILYSSNAVYIGLIHNYLPFMILSIYVALENIDKRILNASYDLGASFSYSFMRIILPLSYSGIRNGCIMVFSFAIADYVIPNILGGSKKLLISNVISNQFITTRDIPFGATLTVLFTILVFAMIYYLYKKN